MCCCEAECFSRLVQGEAVRDQVLCPDPAVGQPHHGGRKGVGIAVDTNVIELSVDECGYIQRDKITGRPADLDDTATRACRSKQARSGFG